MKPYNYKMQTNITRALKHYNEITTNSKFTILDGNILCMVKSFSDNGSKFFMSEKEIAENTISSEKTVQRSINRLCEAGLLKKEKDYTDGKCRRVLIYQPLEVQNILDLK